jgi:flagellar biosynthesis/type III secretory pathway chaperone
MEIATLKEIMKKEAKALNKLLLLLEEQYELLVKNNVFELESIVDRIQLCNKEVAQSELDRRKFMGKISLNEIVNQSNDDELKKIYKEIKDIIFNLQIQKESNEMLIKQGLAFSNKVLSIITPNKGRPAVTYNNYGKIGR